MTEALGFFAGIRAVARGARRLLGDGSLRRLAIAPVLVTLLVYVVGLGTAALTVDDLVAAVWSPPEGSWARAGWTVVVALVFVVLAAVMVLLFVALATAIAGPFHERIALRILDELGVERRDVTFLHGLAIDLSWALTFAVPAGALGLVALIPGVGLPFAVASVTIAAIGLAGASAGPAVSATGGGYGARMRLLWARFRYLAGAALVLAATVLVPVLGLLVVPAAVIGLTEGLARAGALGAPAPTARS